MTRSRYVMEDPTEAMRLEAKTREDVTRQHLALVGLAPGMRALDAGAGTGAVARVMAQVVGPQGQVVAFDASAERLAHGRQLAQAQGLAHLRFVQGDLYAPPLEPGSFDLVWSRFVFEYLAEPDAALAQMVRLTRPGGKVAVADLDGNIVFHHPTPPRVREGLERLMAALSGHFDPYAGRALFSRFRKAGLRDIRVHCLPYHLYAGSIPATERPNWEQKFRTIRAEGVQALRGEEPWDAFVAAYLAMLDDPDSLTYSTLFLVEGIR